MKPSPDTEELVCHLRTVDKLSYIQIAKAADLSKGQVGRILFNAGLTSSENALFPRSRRKPKRLPPAVGAMPAPPPGIEMARTERTKRPCLWPQVDPKRDKAECGSQAIKYDGRELPYCPPHCRRAYQGFGG